MKVTNGEIGCHSYTDEDWQWYKEHLGIDENTKLIIPESNINDPEIIFATNGKIGGYSSKASKILVDNSTKAVALVYESGEFHRPFFLRKLPLHSDIDNDTFLQDKP